MNDIQTKMSNDVGYFLELVERHHLPQSEIYWGKTCYIYMRLSQSASSVSNQNPCNTLSKTSGEKWSQKKNGRDHTHHTISFLLIRKTCYDATI